MKTNFFVGIIVAAIVYLAIVVTSFHDSQDNKKELVPPMPQMLILPEPPPIDTPDVDLSDYHNLA